MWDSPSRPVWLVSARQGPNSLYLPNVGILVWIMYLLVITHITNSSPMKLSFLQTIVAHTYKFTAGLDYILDIKHFVDLSKFSCWLLVF